MKEITQVEIFKLFESICKEKTSGGICFLGQKKNCSKELCPKLDTAKLLLANENALKTAVLATSIWNEYAGGYDRLRDMIEAIIEEKPINPVEVEKDGKRG